MRVQCALDARGVPMGTAVAVDQNDVQWGGYRRCNASCDRAAQACLQCSQFLFFLCSFPFGLEPLVQKELMGVEREFEKDQKSVSHVENGQDSVFQNRLYGREYR